MGKERKKRRSLKTVLGIGQILYNLLREKKEILSEKGEGGRGVIYFEERKGKRRKSWWTVAATRRSFPQKDETS